MHFATGQDSKIFVPKILLAAIDIYANVNAVPANKFRSAVTTLWQSDAIYGAPKLDANRCRFHKAYPA